MRMLVITGDYSCSDSVFLEAEAVVEKLILEYSENGITPHPFLIGCLSLAAPPETPQSITCSRAARYNLQPISTNGFI